MIPEAAVEAARVAVRAAMIEFGPDGHTDGDEEITRAALEAAAPYMLAEAWDDGEAAGQDNADSNRGHDIAHKYNPYRS